MTRTTASFKATISGVGDNDDDASDEENISETRVILGEAPDLAVLAVAAVAFG